MLKSTYDRSEVEGWQKIMDTLEVTGFEHTNSQVVVALRGTEGTAKDWSNNAVYGLGGEMAYKMTPRYKRAKERVAQLEKNTIQKISLWMDIRNRDLLLNFCLPKQGK